MRVGQQLIKTGKKTQEQVGPYQKKKKRVVPRRVG